MTIHEAVIAPDEDNLVWILHKEPLSSYLVLQEFLIQSMQLIKTADYERP